MFSLTINLYNVGVLHELQEKYVD